MRRYLIFAAVGLGLLMYSLDSTAVAVAFPNFLRDFHATLLWAAWTISIYYIAVTMWMPLVGNLSDSLGRKRVYLASLAPFHVQLSCLRPCAQHLRADSVQVLPGHRRRRLPPDRVRDSERLLPGEPGPGHRPFFEHFPDRAHHRPELRRMDREPLFVALHLLHQPADRRDPDDRRHPAHRGDERPIPLPDRHRRRALHERRRTLSHVRPQSCRGELLFPLAGPGRSFSGPERFLDPFVLPAGKEGN